MNHNYNRVSVQDLLNDTPVRGRIANRNTERPDIFNIKCDMDNCGRKFADVVNLEAHQRRSHAPLTMFWCKHCNSSFSTSPNLNKHIRSVHNKVKPFKCEQCNAVFGFRDGLQRHTSMVHEQKRPFVCEHCRLRFKTKAHLGKHFLAVHPEVHQRKSSASSSNM